MKKICQYEFAKADSLTKLQEEVNSLMTFGFQPYGEPFQPVDGFNYAQTMVVYEEADSLEAYVKYKKAMMEAKTN